MPKAKVFSKCSVNDLDRHCDELPTPIADLGACATGSYRIVVGQINIEY
jgi:hypothetical protein